MNPAILICSLCCAAVLSANPALATTAADEKPHAQAYFLPGHDRIGKPGNAALATRTIDVIIKETGSGNMLFEPDAIHIKTGSVVRFEISNYGALEHEFFLGSFDEVGEHLKWMGEHPDMQHDDANAITIQSGEKAELVWEFSNMTNLEFACLIPGRREAGMWGVIMVHDHLAPKSKS